MFSTFVLYLAGCGITYAGLEVAKGAIRPPLYIIIGVGLLVHAHLL